MSDDIDLDLWGIDPFAPRARQTDPETSHDAAEVANYHAVDAAILLALGTYWITGLTTLELEFITGIPRVSISPRLKPLEGMGLVIRTDGRRRAFGIHGEPGIVWILR